MSTIYQGAREKAVGGTAAALILIGSASQGRSALARYVAEQQISGMDHLLSSNAFGVDAPVAKAKLLQVFEECQKPDWDGCGALPVSEETFRLALQLLRALPLGSAIPTFGADPDGELSFEWYRSGKTLSVSVSSGGDLHYAAIIGARKIHGTEPFFGEVPKLISDLIRDVA